MTECPDCVLCCAVLVWCPVLFPNIFNLVLKFSALPGIRLPLERLLEFLPTTSTSKSLWVLGEIMAASVFASHSPPFSPHFLLVGSLGNLEKLPSVREEMRWHPHGCMVRLLGGRSSQRENTTVLRRNQ